VSTGGAVFQQQLNQSHGINGNPGWMHCNQITFSIFCRWPLRSFLSERKPKTV